ncbi:MAG: hypothetical protein F4X66_12710 [Chloroflexi bacterium]|nr:hypothetical protein [Chloroflexota bacterium]MYE39372.1 hypothetical protein [Chloroflexota bacterium]
MMKATVLLAISIVFAALILGCGNEATPRPSPDATSTPTATSPIIPPTIALPTISPTPAVEADSVSPAPAEGFPTPPERDLYRLARELIPGVGEVGRIEGAPVPALAVGHRQSFQLVDLQEMERYSSEFELRLVTPNAYWFLEDGLEIDMKGIEKSAAEFEDTIYPSVTKVFGAEWKPGVDGDPHLYVLNASLKLVGGYYSPADEYPKEIRPVSNEIEAIYINVRAFHPGSQIYDLVLAHELQHAIHWNADPSETTWVNEGLSELAVNVAGYPETSGLAFRRAGPTSLTVWPAGDVGGAENYGAAYLFMHYMTGQYGGRTDLRPLLSQQADGADGVDAYLESLGYDVQFTDVFRDWAIANLLDEGTGRYGYRDLDVSVPVYRGLDDGEELKSSIPQFSTEYVRLELPDGPSTLSFEGDEAAPLLPVDVGSGCWWSNNGDDIDSTLSARADLRAVDKATLDYQVWYAIEEDWDYAYLEVSTDNGQTWQILETAYTSSGNPLSSAFGPGYTGSSDGWLRESVSLDQWAGTEILIRFQYITDASLYDHGLCLRGLSVSGLSGEEEVVEWQPRGFSWTNNLVRQNFVVQVIYEGRDDADNRVLQLELDSANRGEMALDPAPGLRRVVAAVQSMASSTRMPTQYTIGLKSVE